ncbi:hypothetical protein [Chitinophaga sp. HK235]|uniref:hypothetical protein n=1 Tax=Chitinophaga sp. HK235 TaxID=2952571 RepID=UPI001BA5CB8E|nr:hypothetical protein [Chitinophaga sp. HK235]
MRKKITCLLIDEQKDSRNQFFLALDLLQISKACICFDNPGQALSYAAMHQWKPDYIFLRTNRPALDGKNNLGHLQRLPLLADVPVIFYAKEFCPDDMTRMKYLGAADWLIKSSDLHALRDGLKLIFETVKMKQPARGKLMTAEDSAVLV